MEFIDDSTETIASVQVRSLEYRSTSELSALSTLLTQTLSQWATDWMLPSQADFSALTCVNAGAMNALPEVQADWIALHAEDAKDGRVGTAMAWVRLEGIDNNRLVPVAWLRKLLFGEIAKASLLPDMSAVDSDMAGDIAAAAWSDLISNLRMVMRLPEGGGPAITAAIPATQCQSWRGAVQFNLPWDGAGLWLYLNAACVGAVTPLVPARRNSITALPATKPVPLMQALQEQSLQLSADLQPINLSMGDLQGLRLNDIVLLRHRLDEPVLIRMKDGDQLGTGFLGKNRGNWAIEIDAGVSDLVRASLEN